MRRNTNMSGVDISIIIVSWNVRDLLRRALECVYATVQRTSFEIIIVDNCSHDGSVEMIREQFPDVQLVVNTENSGFGRANNQAAALAKGRYLLLLNPDAFVHEQTIDRLAEFLDTHPDVGAVGPRLRYEDGQLQRSCTAFPTVLTELWMATGLDRAFPQHRVFGHYWLTYWDMNDTREVDSIMGACLLLRRTAIDKIGLFDEQFFMYSEEVDLCYRLQAAGWKNLFLHEVEATHIWGGSARQVPAETFFLRLVRSRMQFFRKHYSRRVVVGYKAVIGLSALLRVLGGPITFALRHKRDTVRAYLNYLSLLRTLNTL